MNDFFLIFLIFYNDLDLNNQKILCLPSIYEFERTGTNLNHPNTSLEGELKPIQIRILEISKTNPRLFDLFCQNFLNNSHRISSIKAAECGFFQEFHLDKIPVGKTIDFA